MYEPRIVHCTALMGDNPETTLTDAERELLARRREIAEAAIALADAEGIDAVSMRNVAARVGVGTMTLYTWVESKDDLLAAMSDALADQLLIPEPMPTDWRAALAQIAMAARDTFAAHPWMLCGGRPGGRAGANILRHVDQSLRAVGGLELDGHQRVSILNAIDHYALGCAMADRRRDQRAKHERGASGRDYGRAFKAIGEHRAHIARTEGEASRGELADVIATRELFDSGEAPALSELFGGPEAAMQRIGQGPPEVEAGFEEGLEWLLDGIATMIERAAER